MRSSTLWARSAAPWTFGIGRPLGADWPRPLLVAGWPASDCSRSNDLEDSGAAVRATVAECCRVGLVLSGWAVEQSKAQGGEAPAGMIEEIVYDNLLARGP